MSTTVLAGAARIGGADPSFAWDGTRLIKPAVWRPGTPPPADVRGPVAAFQFDADGRYRLARDPLGLHKLFWSATPAGELLVATRPARLVEAGRPFDTIRAFPRGTVADVDPAAGTVEVRRLGHGTDRPHATPLEDLAAGIRDGLQRYLAAIAAAWPRAQVFVCASGGLHSSGIAALAREQFRDVVAVSFDLRRCGRPGSEDRRTAQRLARDLGLLFLEATVAADDLLDTLDTVLVEGSDWRELHVHAGLVHAALASVIADAAPRDRPALVMTGGAAGALLAERRAAPQSPPPGDARPGTPRAEPRATHVDTLDTANHEVGPFAAWGLPIVRPYAAVADRYLALPDAFLANPRRKADLARLVFGGRIPGYVYARSDARARPGDPEADAGVPTLCASRGIDQQWLRRRFAQLHRLDPDDGCALDRFIRHGLYRSGIPTRAADGD
ncbi:MAG TPA: asparagine synthase-related protein [Longimicrobiales bacterium]